MTRKVNLNAYFERIGFAGSIAPNLATLELIHALHPATIPFENLNPLLGLPVTLDQPSLEKKLLADRRGGYCYEHNLLLKSVLQELDYTVRGLGARVLWGRPDATDVPPTHMLMAVDISGATYIVDVGFGGLTITAPLRLRADAEQQTPHGLFRLTGGEPDWRLEARIGEEWRVLYAFDLTEWSEADYEAPNTFVSTSPESPFTHELRVALAPPGKRLSMLDNRLTIRNDGEPPEQRILTSAAEMRDVLSGLFGINLPPAELLDPKLDALLAKAGVKEV